MGMTSLCDCEMTGFVKVNRLPVLSVSWEPDHIDHVISSL